MLIFLSFTTLDRSENMLVIQSTGESKQTSHLRSSITFCLGIPNIREKQFGVLLYFQIGKGIRDVWVESFKSRWPQLVPKISMLIDILHYVYRLNIHINKHVCTYECYCNMQFEKCVVRGLTLVPVTIHIFLRWQVLI
jgi:hypothetical protein